MGIMPISNSYIDEKLGKLDKIKNVNLEKVIENAVKNTFKELQGGPLPNPNPKNYKILDHISIGEYIILKIKYLDCVNFEGKKILVYRNVSIEKIKNQKLIDPHFSQNTKFISPIARFLPTNEGWDMAVLFCKSLLSSGDKETQNKNKIYENSEMQAPDGELLCRISKAKVQWYLKRNLAELISENPTVIRLKFEPKGRGNSDDPFYLSPKEDICVVSGVNTNLTKHHIVPTCFRKHFPEKYKNHASHDVVLLNRKIHDKYEKDATSLKKEIAKKYNVPMQKTIKISKYKFKKIQESARIILEDFEKNNIEKSEKTIHRKYIRFFTNKKKVSKKDVERILKLSYSDATSCQNNISYGESVVKNLDSIEEFIIMWRKHFVDKTQPKFLPEYWDVNKKI